MIRYMKIVKRIIRNQLVSHALSASTRRLRSLMESISSCRVFVSVMPRACAQALIYCLKIAFLTIYLFRTVRGISSLEGNSAFHTTPIEELTWISKSQTVAMALIRMSVRDRDVMCAVEFQFLRYDSKIFSASFAH